jgi:3',5'-cyclic AMP phosphodiesterase CpdA
VRHVPGPPTPTHVVIQLSDLHIVPEGELLSGMFDPLDNVAAAFGQIEASGVAVTALVLTGDLVDAGDLPSYRRLRALVEARAGALRIPVVYLMGNHDSRGPFRQGLLGAKPTTEPYDHVTWVRGLRIVALDSTEPGESRGSLTDAQLAWLASELVTPAPAGTILALHHPPLPSPVPVLNAVMLAEPRQLAAVIADTDVKIIICGHAHHVSVGALAGIPVAVGGACSYATRPLPPAWVRFSGAAGGMFTRIDVYADQAVATSIPTHHGETLFAEPTRERDAHAVEVG